MRTETKEKILNLLLDVVRKKLSEYKPETEYMPFHHRLLGKDRYAMFSFIQSMNTTFGMSIWEQVAVILADGAGYKAQRQYKLMGEINSETERIITEILSDLRKAKRKPNKNEEIEKIRSTIRSGIGKKHPDSTVDLFVLVEDEENYFDITSSKPNMKEFLELKRKLLVWTALRLSQDKNATVMTRLAIPYNPYHPKPYERWTLKGLYDLKSEEILVGKDFWNFVGGGEIYDDLLHTFQEAGEILRDEIDRKFKKLR